MAIYIIDMSQVHHVLWCTWPDKAFVVNKLAQFFKKKKGILHYLGHISYLMDHEKLNFTVILFDNHQCISLFRFVHILMSINRISGSVYLFSSKYCFILEPTKKTICIEQMWIHFCCMYVQNFQIFCLIYTWGQEYSNL